jgi:hypothetical protein
MMPALRLTRARRIGSAGVAELVDALVLGTSGESRGGSSPSARTTQARENASRHLNVGAETFAEDMDFRERDDGNPASRFGHLK